MLDFFQRQILVNSMPKRWEIHWKWITCIGKVMQSSNLLNKIYVWVDKKMMLEMEKKKFNLLTISEKNKHRTWYLMNPKDDYNMINKQTEGKNAMLESTSFLPTIVLKMFSPHKHFSKLVHRTPSTPATQNTVDEVKKIQLLTSPLMNISRKLTIWMCL